MKIRTTHLFLALALPALAACSGPSADDDVATRIARAASSAAVDLIMSADEKDASPEAASVPAEPLALAASRPDSILDSTGGSPLESLATDVMASAVSTIRMPQTAPSGQASIGHVVTSTSFSTFLRTCEEQDARTKIAKQAPRASEAGSPVACTSPRTPRGTLTRT